MLQALLELKRRLGIYSIRFAFHTEPSHHVSIEVKQGVHGTLADTARVFIGLEVLENSTGLDATWDWVVRQIEEQLENASRKIPA